LRWEVFVALCGSQLGDKRFADDAEKKVRKWLRQQSKDLYAARFHALLNHGTSVSVSIDKCFTFYIRLLPIY
jgi:hypothetical protein